ncbi:MAG: succinate dehydrogenase, hydrophobic membrane anchor protein [Alphaproteobacteria bacterium]
MSGTQHKDPYAADLKKAKGRGSAHEGTHHWMMQKITAIALIPLIVWLIYSIISLKGASYEEFTSWMSSPFNAVLSILFIITSLYHAVLGNQVIIEDYIACESFKTFKLIGQKLFFFALGVLSIFSILKIAL